MARYMRSKSCPVCRGTRLKEASLAVTVGGMNIAQLTALTVKDVQDFLARLSLSEKDAYIARQVMKGCRHLGFHRRGPNADSGPQPRPFQEGAQRIRLATQIGSGLTGLFIFWMSQHRPASKG